MARLDLLSKKFKLSKEARLELRTRYELKPKKRAKNYKESVFQRQAIEWLRLQYPQVFAFHVPSEGRHKPQYRRAQKLAGVVSGIPDILIVESGYNGHVGLAVELKVGYKTPKDSQLEVLRMFEDRGWKCIVVWTLEDFQRVVNSYLTSKSELTWL